MREPWAMREPDGLTSGVAISRPSRNPIGTKSRLAATVLTHLPLGVAVIDAGSRLLYWNEHAGQFFGIPPLMAAECPTLTSVLAGVSDLNPGQRERIQSFCESHIEAGDRTGPDSCLRLSLGRQRRIAMQMRGIGYNRWLITIDEGKTAVAAGSAVNGPEDAWLDALTGLSNRHHFNKVARDLFETPGAAIRHALLLIDLDGFKSVNEMLGHAVGDALLGLVAQRLRRETREDDLLVRLGGDEFVVLIPNPERAEVLAARVIDILSRPYLVEGYVANIGASIGIARFPDHAASADELMRHADLALFGAKAAGGRTWRLFEPDMAEEAKARREMEGDVRKALNLGELSLVYQAQLDVRSRSLAGFEALLRWTHPVRGAVPPVEFIPVAEEIGCIATFGDWVLRMACKEAVRWPEPLTVAVNVSPRQLEDSGRLYDSVQIALQSSGLAAERLELEITETSLLSRDPAVLQTLHKLRADGVRIAMDDFGTGYASLSQLRSFPFDKIKIDRCFVASLGQDDDSTAVVQAIAALGSGLGMTTTAEGVETDVQAALVEAGGCSHIQGYLISRPIPPAEVAELVRRYSGDVSLLN